MANPETTLDDVVQDVSQQLSSTTLDDERADTEHNDEGLKLDEDVDKEPLDVELCREGSHHSSPKHGPGSIPSNPNPPQSTGFPPAPLFDDPSDEDDGEGEWITASNVSIHKSRALNLLPSDSGKGKGKTEEPVHTGCMTADFAMQNVLLRMGLGLISVDGKRIEKVKSWVLRCHACFKFAPLL